LSDGVSISDEVHAALGSRLGDALTVFVLEETDLCNAGSDERHDDVLVLVALIEIVS
jgi:hypothetical protein